MSERQHQFTRVAAPPKATTSAPRPGVRTLSGGHPIHHSVQTEMSARFGHDFRQVRIHSDREAAVSTQALGARACTLGNDIFFGEDKYAPGSAEGDRLLAHELTHVVQQSRFGSGAWEHTSRRTDASEREADALASRVVQGKSVEVQQTPEAAIARDVDSDAINQAAGDLVPKIKLGDYNLQLAPMMPPDAPTPYDNPAAKRQQDWDQNQAKQRGDDYPNPIPGQLKPPTLGPLPSMPFTPQPPGSNPMAPCPVDPGPTGPSLMPPGSTGLPWGLPGSPGNSSQPPAPADPSLQLGVPYKPDLNPTPPMVPPLTLDPSLQLPPVPSVQLGVPYQPDLNPTPPMVPPLTLGASPQLPPVPSVQLGVPYQPNLNPPNAGVPDQQ